MKYRLAFIFWNALILYGLLSPNPGGVTKGIWLFEGEDKMIHFVLFAVFSWLLLVIMVKEWQRYRKKKYVFVLITGTTFACLTEWLQQFVSLRHPRYWDFIFDMTGVTIAILLHLILSTFYKNLFFR